MDEKKKLVRFCHSVSVLTVVVSAIVLFCEIDAHYFLPAAMLIAINFRVQAIWLNNGGYEDQSLDFGTLVLATWFFGPLVALMVNIHIRGSTLVPAAGNNIRLESILSLIPWLSLGAFYLSGPLLWLLTVRHYRLQREKGKGKNEDSMALNGQLAQRLGVESVVEPALQPDTEDSAPPRRPIYD